MRGAWGRVVGSFLLSNRFSSHAQRGKYVAKYKADKIARHGAASSTCEDHTCLQSPVGHRVSAPVYTASFDWACFFRACVQLVIKHSYHESLLFNNYYPSRGILHVSRRALYLRACDTSTLRGVQLIPPSASSLSYGTFTWHHTYGHCNNTILDRTHNRYMYMIVLHTTFVTTSPPPPLHPLRLSISYAWRPNCRITLHTTRPSATAQLARRHRRLRSQ